MLDPLLAEIRACRQCAGVLPLGPRPIVHARATARLLIASQAPGTKVHRSGVSFDDASGDRLRAWLGMSRAQFYDDRAVALVPMGFCYPGRLAGGGDAPPRPECAPLWRHRLLGALADIRLTLLVGGCAQAAVLGAGAVGARVRGFERYLPRYFPLPHPSWRTTGWERANPWFAERALPALRAAVAAALGGP